MPRADRPRRGHGVINNLEAEILTLLASGLAPKQIATRVHRSPETIKGYLALIRWKLDALNTTNAVAIAIRRALIQPPEHPH